MKENNTIIITGCARGIGRGLTLFFSAYGYRVVGIDIDKKEGESLHNKIGSGHFIFHHGSVADAEFLESVYSSLDDENLIGLVNNAGIADPYTGPIEKLDMETWQNYLSVNLTGAMLNTKFAVPHLRKHQGAIVNITSTRAYQSEPNSECYAATKGGLVALTHATAVSLGPEIRVNAIAPGWIDVTRHQGEDSDPYEFRDKDLRQHPAGIVGEPGDIAHAVEYLLSDRSRFVTGQVLKIEGGMTRKMIYED